MKLSILCSRQQRLKFLVLLACAIVWSFGGAAPSIAQSSNTVAASASGTNTVPIPLAQVAAQSEAAHASLRAIEDSLATDPATSAIQADLMTLTRDTSLQLEESTRQLASSPSLETLRRLTREWQPLSEELGEWKRSLSKRMTQLQQEQQQLDQMDRTWAATRAAGPGLPAELLQRIDQVIAAVKRTQEQAQAQQTLVLTLQARVSEQDGRARHVLSLIERAHDAFIRRLLVRDSPALWSAQLWSETATNLAQQSNHSLGRQVQALRGYTERKGERLIVQAIIFLALAGGLILLGRTVRPLAAMQGSSRSSVVFDAPVVTALVLAFLASSWIYPQAPRLWWAILGAAALVPTALLVRRVIDHRLFPILKALILFYLVDQLRVIVASEALLSRIVVLGEMLGGALWIGWLLRPAGFGRREAQNRSGKMLNAGLRIALLVFAAASLLNFFGLVTLSKLLSHALLQSAYMALILYAVVRIVGDLFFSVLTLPPFVRLAVVKRHHDLLERRTLMVLKWIAIVCWVVFVLETLSLRAPVFADLREVLIATWGAGAFKISLGDILLFAITVWAAFMVSRLLCFILEEEVYPRIHLAPGLHYSISKMVNYAILVVGFFIGLAILGLDLTRLTILVGAFGVGLGFGLQNIINNFVSGLILLFERPIKVGDVVQISGTEGLVKHIGIRASIVRVANGSEIIVPNGSLISETVTNWTFSDRLRRIDLPLAVAGTPDAQKVMGLIEQVAAQQPLIMKDPAPRVLLVSFTADTLNLELRVWTNQSEDWSQIRSNLSMALRAALAQQSITVK